VPAVGDVAEFLRRHPPFDLLHDTEIEQLAGQVEIAFHPAGETLFTQGTAVDCVWVVRTGSVDIVSGDASGDAVLDVADEGDLLGQTSMISGLPSGFTARAAEDTLVYRIPADAVQPLLSRPRALSFLVRSMLRGESEAGRGPDVADPLRRTVGSLLRMAPVTCDPDDPIRDVARLMTAQGASAVIVGGRPILGIVTDTNLRTQVIGAGLDPGAPVRLAMSVPVHTIAVDSLGADALLEMLARGIQHLPVTDPSGRLVGVLQHHDLVSAETRTPLVVRRRIARAGTVADVVEASTGLRAAAISMRDTGADGQQVSALWSVVVDALTARLIDLNRSSVSGSPMEFTWLALGSIARREGAPSSDVDSALVWSGQVTAAGAEQQLAPVTRAVSAGLEACGFRPDEHGLTAADPPFARSMPSWRDIVRDLGRDPSGEKSTLLTSVLLDSRPVWWEGRSQTIAQLFVDSPGLEPLLRVMGRHALAHRIPTGFLRDFVVESGGQRRGLLDLKRRGLLPIVDLARWAGVMSGVSAASTRERLRAAGGTGVLEPGQVADLVEALDVVTDVRIAHQLEQLEAGDRPDDDIRPGRLSSIGRAQLREAFRAVASVQRALQAEFIVGAR
jgi:CBS domain-containing protein